MENRRNRFDKIDIASMLPWVQRITAEQLVCSPRVMDWCGLSYPGHPRGCPNFKQPNREHCPYNTRYVLDYLDRAKPLYLVFSEFDLAAHVLTMRIRYPSWTERQLRNVLYWQQRPKAELRRRAQALAKMVGADLVVTAGESVGINLYATCARAGHRLEKIHSLRQCCFVALVGWRVKIG